MKSTQQLICLAARKLHECGACESEELARKEADFLLAHLLRCSVMELYLHPPLCSDADEKRLLQAVQRRLAGEPLAYILGWVDFYRERYCVSAATLIPRPETEELVCLLAQDSAAKSSSVRTILDLGTGSGCLAVSLARVFSEAQVYAWDVSDAALAVAQKNVEAYALGERVQLRQGDMRLTEFWQQLKEQGVGYDLIVSNPPYVRSRERSLLSAETRSYEPWLALHGGTEGLDFYQLIKPHIKDLLEEGGVFAAEIGLHHGEPLSKLFGSGDYSPQQGYAFSLRRDMQGKERFIILHRSSHL